MDKEGQSIQFSSDKISEKKKPDFFIASNEKAARRERSSIGAFFAKIGGFFKRLGARILDYIKHPFRGKHKILTISLFIVVVAVVVIIVLNLTIWQKTTKDTTPLSEEEMAEWAGNFSEIVHEASLLSDDDFRTYYSNLMEGEKSEYKYIDLVIGYANELSYRGFVDQSLDILGALVEEDMSCGQIKKYYNAYSKVYLAMGNGVQTSEGEYYQTLAAEQEDICLFGEVQTIEPEENADAE